MALLGVHIVCARVAARAGAALPTYSDWSETLANPGTTVNTAVDVNSLFQISSAVDAYFAVGKAPDATQVVGAGSSARYFLQAGSTREVFGTSGDKVTWAAA